MLVIATATGAVGELEHRCSRSFMSRELHSTCSAANWSQSPGERLGQGMICETCRATVCFDMGDRDLLSIGIDRLDEPSRVRPTFHQCVSSKLPWLEINDGLPRFSENTITHPKERQSRRRSWTNRVTRGRSRVGRSMLHVREYGDTGPRVIVLHGGPGAAGHMVPIARGLSGSYRVIEPLQRGSGGERLKGHRRADD
jgi:hypothetical protein